VSAIFLSHNTCVSILIGRRIGALDASGNGPEAFLLALSIFSICFKGTRRINVD
jgi:hypothetical protein